MARHPANKFDTHFYERWILATIFAIVYLGVCAFLGYRMYPSALAAHPSQMHFGDSTARTVVMIAQWNWTLAFACSLVVVREIAARRGNRLIAGSISRVPVPIIVGLVIILSALQPGTNIILLVPMVIMLFLLFALGDPDMRMTFLLPTASAFVFLVVWGIMTWKWKRDRAAISARGRPPAR